MTDRFPTIRNIEDLRPRISEEGGIRVYERRDHILINYMFADRETFQTEFDLECRGITFDPDSGDILARPLHKFFNLGEREQPNEVDFISPHHVQAKLDGSMVFGIKVSGSCRFFTRGGPSIQAQTAWERASYQERAFVSDAVSQGLTPIFEWTAPDNRIIIPYAANALTLLAVRERESGAYLGLQDLKKMAGPFGVGIVDEIGVTGPDWSEHSKVIRAMRGVEGVVIAFDDGHRIKLKSDEYVIRHRALGGVGEEKNTVKALLDDALDDVEPLLSDDIRSRLSSWKEAFSHTIRSEADRMREYCEGIEGLDPKGRALAIQSDLDKPRQAIAFQVLKSRNAVEVLREAIEKNTTTRAKYDHVAKAFGLPRWDLGMDLEV